MNSSATPVTNRLILAVLSLILVCLVLLVVKAYRRPDTAQAPAPEPVTVASPSEPAATGPVRKPIAFVPRPGADFTPVSVTNTVVTPGEVRETVLQPVETTAVVMPPPHYTPGGAWPSAGQPAGGGVGQGGSTEGRITGMVQLLGTPPPEVLINLGPSCGRLNTNRVTTRHYVVGPNRGLANVVVYVSAASAKALSQPVVQPGAEPTGPLLDQVGCMFEPYVMAVRTGQTFYVLNSDPELHNLHFTPRHNPERNIAQSRQGQIDTFHFTKPELFIRLKCDVHPWMFAYVSALPHRHFAVTDANGVFRLPHDLPSGRYTLTAAHLKTGRLDQEIVLESGRTPSPVRFEFPIESSRRSPSPLVVGTQP